MTAPSTQEKQPTLLGLHLLRGLCAIAVMFYHYLHEAGVGTFHAVGTYGVYIFFALSGYALTYVYGEKRLNGRSLGNFFVSRVFRILPLYFVVATYQLYMLRATPGIWEKYLLNVTMFFGLATPGATSMVPGGWSIGIEAVFYLMFPLILCISNLRALAGMLLFAAFINHVMTAWSYTTPVIDNQWMAYTQAPTFLVYFIGGALLARLRPRIVEFMLQHKKLSSLLPPILAIIIVAMFFIPSAMSISRQEIILGLPAKIMIMASLLVIAIASLLELRSRMEALALFLGEISYSLYLLHYPVWYRVQMHVNADLGIQALLAIVVSLVLATLTYRYFEKPMRDLKYLPAFRSRLAPTD
ncbi:MULTISPECIES: acyltransferase [unclassified Devosia]|uniref:acyltransferase family protein n=1 Tax=unclassified Devosia TaxID=196773 RepID=UPI0015F920B4|nr:MULTISPECIES: acyltransferase [unclassified Devosia]MBJ6986952.1 acyltransferase [Devosia sp. MC521]MBK1793351.1 acyltransferase [Devosia sp. WQ 349K1]QMW63976.1 acyltransferase [Devosia sp. MC521]